MILLLLLIPIFINALKRCPNSLAVPIPVPRIVNCRDTFSKIKDNDGSYYCCDNVLSCGNPYVWSGPYSSDVNAENCRAPLHKITKDPFNRFKDEYTFAQKNEDGEYIICEDDSQCKSVNTSFYCGNVNTERHSSKIPLKMCFLSPGKYLAEMLEEAKQCDSFDECNIATLPKTHWCRILKDEEKDKFIMRLHDKFCAPQVSCDGGVTFNGNECDTLGAECTDQSNTKQVCQKRDDDMMVCCPQGSVRIPTWTTKPPQPTTTPAPVTPPTPIIVAPTPTLETEPVDKVYSTPPRSPPPPPKRYEEQIAIIGEILKEAKKVKPKAKREEAPIVVGNSSKISLLIWVIVLGTVVLTVLSIVHMVFKKKKRDRKMVATLEKTSSSSSTTPTAKTTTKMDDSDLEIEFVDD